MKLRIRDVLLHRSAGPPERGELLVQDGRIVAIDPPSSAPGVDGELVEGGGRHLAPGLIDLQVNGGFGADFTSDPASIAAVARRLPEHGVTSFLPTIITSPAETVRRARETVLALEQTEPAARVLGLHLEGPYLHPEKKGAHELAHLRLPDPGETTDWGPGGGVRMVTLAPELEGALPLVRELERRGVLVAVGHTTAKIGTMRAARAAGARYVTHLFNAMPALHHREPGVVGAALGSPHWVTGMIVDGVHVAPEVVALSFRLKGPDAFNMVTDAMAALGMSPGSYRIGGQEVVVEGGRAHLADGTLAGSVVHADECLRNLMEYSGCSLAEALSTMTSTPARLMGMDAEIGRLAVGARADMVLLEGDGRLIATWVGGRTAFRCRE